MLIIEIPVYEYRNSTRRELSIGTKKYPFYVDLQVKIFNILDSICQNLLTSAKNQRQQCDALCSEKVFEILIRLSENPEGIFLREKYSIKLLIKSAAAAFQLTLIRSRFKKPLHLVRNAFLPNRFVGKTNCSMTICPPKYPF